MQANANYFLFFLFLFLCNSSLFQWTIGYLGGEQYGPGKYVAMREIRMTNKKKKETKKNG